jgi:Pyruvate/2-oxoacid:ferredoxin oxidoreductase delta subunit
MRNPLIKDKNRRNWPLILRRTTQIGFVIFILAASLRHGLFGDSSASIDALCPFGGLETLWRMLAEGQYIPKTHPSTIVLGIGLLVIVFSFWVQRAWCKYLCPLGGALSLLGHLSFLRIRRSTEACKGCAICDTPCPVGILVSRANPRVSTNCIGCLACVEACPRHATLEVQLAPSWWDGIRSLVNRFRRPAQASGD